MFLSTITTCVTQEAEIPPRLLYTSTPQTVSDGCKFPRGEQDLSCRSGSGVISPLLALGMKPVLSSFGQQKVYPQLPAWNMGLSLCFWSFMAMPLPMHLLTSSPFPLHPWCQLSKPCMLVARPAPPRGESSAFGYPSPTSPSLQSAPNTQHFFLNHSFLRPAPTPVLIKIQRLARYRVAFHEFLGRTCANVLFYDEFLGLLSA